MSGVADIFTSAKEAIDKGGSAFVQAKMAEVVERQDRKKNRVREAVRGATVAPKSNLPARAEQPGDTAEGMPAWQKVALISAAVVAAVYIAKKVL